MEGNMARFLPTPPILKEQISHDMTRGEKELGPLFQLVDSTLVPEADVTIGVRYVEKEPS